MPDKTADDTRPGVGAVGKRSQIQRSQRMMFVWVTIMSAVVGFCVVIVWLLIQQFMFHAKVLDALNTTTKTLEDNISAVSTLQSNIRVLETNAALNSIKANPDDRALQVVLDSLPADNNPLALSSSVQNNLVGGSSGVTLESLSIDSSATINSKASANTIPFRLTVSATNPDDLKSMLNRFEHSIRVIDIDTFSLNSQGTRYTLTLLAHGYYEPALTVKLDQKSVGGK